MINNLKYDKFINHLKYYKLINHLKYYRLINHLIYTLIDNLAIKNEMNDFMNKEYKADIWLDNLVDK